MLYALGTWSPEIAPDCFVAESAEVIGKVLLQSGSTIWMGAVLRGDIEEIVIGKNSNVQENSSLHTSEGFPLVLGENVTIGHSVTLHSCRVGTGSLIGMGATVLDGVEVGEGCLVGAGALLPPGTKYPENSLIIGAPAQCRKTLDQSSRDGILANARLYYELGQRYRKELVPLQSLEHLPSPETRLAKEQRGGRNTLETALTSSSATEELRLGLREQQWKLVVYVPAEEGASVEKLKAALFAAGAGELGTYCECSWQSLGQGQFRPGSSSQPAIGQAGQLSQVPELRLELLFSAGCLQEVIKALYAAHPYETPAYEVFPVYYV